MKIQDEWKENSKEWGQSIQNYLFNEVSYDDLKSIEK